MDFKQIWSGISQYKTSESEGSVGAQLREIVKKDGIEIFKNADRMTSAVAKLKADAATRSQLMLIFSGSHIKDFVTNTKSDMNLIDVDNAIHDVIKSTGLTQKVAVRLVTDIFYACGLDFSVEYAPVLEAGKVTYRLCALMPNEAVKGETERIEQILGSYKIISDEAQRKAVVNEAAEGMTRLCNAGVPQGFLMLGKCYLSGECGTEKDIDKAKEYLKIASDGGIPEASALLGDVLYLSGDPFARDYTLAHYYYTRPGAQAMGKKQQAALKDIYMQGSANTVTLIMSGVIFVLTLLFTIYFNSGIFSGNSRAAVGVIADILSCAIFAVAVRFHILKKYNNIRGIIAGQHVIWALYAFILLLA